MQAIGKLYTLWTAFARFYERHGDIDNARIIFDKATQVRPQADRLGAGSTWCKLLLDGLAPKSRASCPSCWAKPWDEVSLVCMPAATAGSSK